MSSDPVIDPAILEEEQAAGRATRRKTRSSTGVEARTSSRLAGRVGTSPTANTVAGGSGSGIGVGVGSAAARKGKGKERENALGDTEPTRGEEENLIGSEYKFRGKRRRQSHGKSITKSASKSPVKKRSRLPSGKGNNGAGDGKEDEMSGIDDLADAASVLRPNPPIPLIPLRPPYPLGTRPYRFPCLRPGQPAPPNTEKPFKRFDPHEFDDPKSLLEDTASLASDDEDEPTREATTSTSTQLQTPVQAQTTNIGDNLGTYTGGMDGGYGIGGEMDYDTQAYQSLAALLEASNDGELFAQEGQ